MGRLWICGIVLALSLGAQDPPETPATQRPVRPESDEADPGRPVLKRGGPSQKREETAPPPSGSSPKEAAPATAAPPTAASGAAPAQSKPEQAPAVEDLIQRAREAAYEYDSTLPNFICDQITSRYQSRTLKPDWHFKDRVDVELVYFDGREGYRNVRVNGKALKKGAPEDSGTWSSGEFGTMLADIFSTSTNARFRPRGNSSAVGMEAKVYDFSVSQPNSHWTVRYGRSVKPGYNGALWIDPKSARVLRIEMNTRQLPKDYEIDTTEATVDYGWVNVGGQKFLLPVKSENLACFRGTFDCVRNEIEFRNYRKFAVESQVLQVDSDITFPEAEGDQPASKTTPPSLNPADAKPAATPASKKKQ
jgi:hypothetical protein